MRTIFMLDLGNMIFNEPAITISFISAAALCLAVFFAFQSGRIARKSLSISKLQENRHKPKFPTYFNDELKINLPDSFPVAEYAKFMSTARSVLLSPKSDAWKEFAGASNLIGWRYRACYEYKESYISSWTSEGSNVSFETIYIREKALFGMFTSGVSCIESICYAIYALASHEKSLGLPFNKTEQRNCNLNRLRKKLLEFTGSSKLDKVLSDIIDSQEWNLWIDFRNRMSHRANLPRIIRGAMGSSPQPAKAFEFAATSSTQAIECDENKIEELCSWLSKSLSSLLSGGCDLVPGFK